MAILYDTSGEVREMHPTNGTDFTLEELRELLDCEWVQALPIPPDNYLWLDEEGKLQHHIINVKATTQFRGYLLPGDYIAGKALLTYPGEVK